MPEPVLPLEADLFKSLSLRGYIESRGTIWIKKPQVMHVHLPRSCFTTPVYFNQREVVFVVIEGDGLEAYHRQLTQAREASFHEPL